MVVCADKVPDHVVAMMGALQDAAREEGGEASSAALLAAALVVEELVGGRAWLQRRVPVVA